MLIAAPRTKPTPIYVCGHTLLLGRCITLSRVILINVPESGGSPIDELKNRSRCEWCVQRGTFIENDLRARGGK
ncbi:hypothetical protein KSD_61840 [Ktedonobacter sp. SOSP1-85]|nr:hypothetical protein KSD_61840 [Ktedonobacter sp. SOSP1-85]